MLNGMISSVSGVINTSGTNLAVDSDAIFQSTSTNNIAIGLNALNSTAADSDSNIAIGVDAGTAITTGDYNVLIGNLAGDNFDTESGNVAIGQSAFSGAVAGATSCVAVGRSALKGAATQTGTIAIGYFAGAALTSGVGNLAIGYNAMLEHTTGARNIAIGYGAMDDTGANDCPTSADNTFIGYNSGGGTWANNDCNNNTAVGSATMAGNMDGALYNTALGYAALNDLTTGDANTIIGTSAGDGITTASNNTALGKSALGGVAGSGNTAVGYSTLLACTGDYNTTSGYGVMYEATAVDDCVAIGASALYRANTDTADGTVAIGRRAGNSYVPADAGAATGGTTLIGYDAGNDPDNTGWGLTTGIENTAVGHETLGANANSALTGDRNTVMGYRAGYGLNGGANENTIIGSRAGYQLTIGSSGEEAAKNTIVGAQAMYLSGAGNKHNTAIGFASLYSMDVADASNGYNVGVGYGTGYYLGAGVKNTFLGSNSAYGVSGTHLDGDLNVCVGSTAGYLLQGAAAQNTMVGSTAGNALTTGSNNICIGYGSDLSAVDSADQIVIGKDTTGLGDNYAVIGPAALTRLYVAADGAGEIFADGTINTSDKRTKENINEMSLGLDFINKLCPVEFEKRQPKDYDEDLKSKILEQGNGLRDMDISEKEKIRSGLLAQDVVSSLEEFGYSSNNDIVKVDEKTTKQQLDYSKLVAPLVRAVQELSQQINELKKGK